ncbi:MAG: hypothetical protein IPN17_12010 [Deltaproteobacteria bacterium]|nr:hypothetical protein [Deltaproteobacteria bacterium]
MSSPTRLALLLCTLATAALPLAPREASAQPAPVSAPTAWATVYRITESSGASQRWTWDLVLGTDRAVVVVRGPQAAGVYVASVESRGNELRLRYRSHHGSGVAAVAGDRPMLRLVRGARGAVEARFEALSPNARRRALPAAVSTVRQVEASSGASGHDDLYAIAAAAGDCGPLEVREGGNRVVCASGITLQVGSVPSARLEVRFEAPVAVPVRCTDYLARAGFSTVTLGPTVTLCDVTTGPVTAASTADSIARSYRGRCSRQALRGGEHLACEGRTFSFAGPRLALERVAASDASR